MDSQKVDFFILSQGKYFPEASMPVIRQHLLELNESQWAMLSTIQFKDPITSLILSLLLGYLGIDRFYIGDTGLGIGKLLTGGGCGVWTIVDWFLIMNATKEKNFQRLQCLI